jgi:Restriction endonuclease S subunits
MSKLEELIAELCPDGVEYVSFGDICSIITKQTGFDYTNHIKDSLIREKITDCLPYIQTKFFTGKIFNFETDYYVPYHIVEKFPKITLDSKCILLSIVGASIGNIGLFPGDRKCFLGGAICVAKPHESYNVDYLFYYLTSRDGQKQIFNKVKGAGQATVTIEDIRKFKIPLPPLPVQSEIVRILDNFTELTTELTSELTAELTALKKQYKYYNNYLLSFEYRDDVPMSKLEKLIAELCPDGVEYKCIGEIANCYPGATPKTSKPEYWEKGTIPWMSSGEVNYGDVTFTGKKITQLGYDNSSTKMVPANTVVIALAGQGKTRGTVAITRIPLCTNQSLCAIVTKENILSEFLLYFLRSQYQQLRDVSSGDGTRGGLNLKMINAYKVPVPPMPVQSEIVRILDNFSELTSELTEELTAELTARKKQYEYYRDKLLTFKELS